MPDEPDEQSKLPISEDKNSAATAHAAIGRASLWPWVVFVVGTLLFDLTTEASPRTPAGLRNYVMAAVSGVLTGELCVATTMCLWSRYWLAGYAAATLLAMAGFLSISFGNYFTLRWFNGVFLDITREVVVPVFYIPPLFLLSSIGMIAVRSLRGWRLTRGEVTPQSSAFRITDLLICTALVATLLMMGRSAQLLGTNSAYWIGLAGLSLVFCVASLFTVIPTVWILFRTEQRRAMKMLGVVAVNCVVVMSIVATISQLSAPTMPVQTVLILAGLWVFFAFAYTIIALTLLRKAGFQLHTGRLSVATATATFRSSESRLAVPIGILACFMLTQLILSGLFVYRTLQVAVGRQLMRDMAAHGDRVEIDADGKVTSITLSPAATRSDFLKLREYPNLQQVVLAGTNFNDEDIQLLKPLRQLESLDLNRTSVTDAGLAEIAGWSKVFALSVAGTKCTAAGLRNFVDQHPLHKLDIGYLNLHDAEVEAIAKAIMLRTPNAPIGSRGKVPEAIVLVLAGNPITNDGLFFLASTQHLWSLDLTDCNVDEGCLWTRTFMDLDLDGTKISSTFAGGPKTLDVYGSLSMDRTGVNDKTLPNLTGRTVQHLKFGETQITEQGLSGLGLSDPNQLTLNSRKFTGECFATWKPNLSALDMSHSGVSDSEIEHIVTLPKIYNLALSNTDVSDACLDLLAQSKLIIIDLSGTRVTASGLAKSDWKHKTVSIAANQFPEAEIKMLMKRGSFNIIPPLEKR